MNSTDFSAVAACGIADARLGWCKRPAESVVGLLFGAQGRSAEEWVQQDWTAVASAIDARLAELNWRQRELAERAQVSVAIVRELHRNTAQRRRNARTLEALSVALGWHPEHLDALLRGRTPPDGGDPETAPVDPVTARLTSIDRRLAAIEKHLDDLAARDDTSGQ